MAVVANGARRPLVPANDITVPVHAALSVTTQNFPSWDTANTLSTAPPAVALLVVLVVTVLKTFYDSQRARHPTGQLAPFFPFSKDEFWSVSDGSADAGVVAQLPTTLPDRGTRGVSQEGRARESSRDQLPLREERERRGRNPDAGANPW